MKINAAVAVSVYTIWENALGPGFVWSLGDAMRKLTVKNFSVIEEAELEFGKITALIGPQASGKSLLCKLAYFLSREVIALAVDSIARGDSIDKFQHEIGEAFGLHFPSHIAGSSFEVSYRSEGYSVVMYGDVGNDPRQDSAGLYQSLGLKTDFSDQFKNLYASLISAQAGNVQSAMSSAIDRKNAIWIQLNLFLTASYVLQSMYVPAGRAFFTNASLGFNALRNPDIDPLISAFAAEISWGLSLRLPGQVTSGDDVLDRIKLAMDKIAGGEVRMVGNTPRFFAEDGRVISLSLLSSGTQELLPLFNVVRRLASEQESREVFIASVYDPPRKELPIRSKQLVYVEEPEANIFPSTQYDLVRLFSRLSHEPRLDFSWVITTHSPYIMTAFNTLIEAGRVGSIVGNREKVSAVIPEEYWIQESDFKAYAIENGILISIFKPEAEFPEGEGMIDGDYLDGVSDQLGKEFNRLLDIEFAK